MWLSKMVEPTGIEPANSEVHIGFNHCRNLPQPRFNYCKIDLVAFFGGTDIVFGFFFKSEDIAPLFDLREVLFTDATA